MKKIIVFTILLSSWVFGAEIQCDPRKLADQKSTWKVTDGNFKDEHYRDILYEDNIICRILTRFMPVFQCIRQEAIRSGNNIIYKNLDDGFFASSKSIKENFVSQRKAHYLILKPNEVILENRGFVRDSFYLTIACKSMVISEAIYNYLFALKLAAKNNNRNIKIDILGVLKHSKEKDPDLGNCCKLTKPIIHGIAECCICMDAASNIIFMPCKHLCACEDCALLTKDKCPICQQNYEKQEKIYWQ